MFPRNNFSLNNFVNVVSRCDNAIGNLTNASKKRELTDFRFMETVERSPDGAVRTNVFDAKPVMLAMVYFFIRAFPTYPRLVYTFSTSSWSCTFDKNSRALSVCASESSVALFATHSSLELSIFNPAFSIAFFTDSSARISQYTVHESSLI